MQARGVSAFGRAPVASCLIGQIVFRREVHLALLGQPCYPVVAVAVQPNVVVGQAGIGHGLKRPTSDAGVLERRLKRFNGDGHKRFLLV